MSYNVSITQVFSYAIQRLSHTNVFKYLITIHSPRCFLMSYNDSITKVLWYVLQLLTKLNVFKWYTMIPSPRFFQIVFKFFFATIRSPECFHVTYNVSLTVMSSNVLQLFTHRGVFKYLTTIHSPRCFPKSHNDSFTRMFSTVLQVFTYTTVFKWLTFRSDTHPSIRWYVLHCIDPWYIWYDVCLVLKWPGFDSR